MPQICKYPRTRHIEGSGIQAGDEDRGTVPFTELSRRFLVVEEKMDGANSAISFSADGKLWLQSRGHFLTGGGREKQFELFKAWASRRAAELWALLGDRYVLYGEWLYAKHTIFYTHLPHYWLEYDVYDSATAKFLSTERRRNLLRKAPFIVSVPVLHTGPVKNLKTLQGFIKGSAFMQEPRDALAAACRKQELDFELAAAQTDLTGLMDGLYVKWEADGEVRGRYKYVRGGFLQTVFDSETHWQDRPIIPNQLRPGVDLFA
jgi:hypothetical protein